MSVSSEAVGHRVPAGDARAAAVTRACEGWVRRLYDLSRRNNLLFFRDLSRGTLDLTAADLSPSPSLASSPVRTPASWASTCRRSAAARWRTWRRRA